ncbi:MAG TPA: uroporphyrinogen-III synthase [Candidatus Limnocylindria bacterium]|nr:uroporphyrinogen-III synthase [Candidatus Limnocylindria bacterium]
MKTLLITRPAAQAHELAAHLRERGIGSVCVPTVEIQPDVESLRTSLTMLDQAAWLVITSTNGAEALARATSGSNVRVPSHLRLAAVGPATAGALRRLGFTVDYVPHRYLTSAIADGLGDVRGRLVVLARADAASPALSRELGQRGAIVHDVVAYRTVEAPAGSRDMAADALEQPLDGITFTSGSTARGLVSLLPPEQRTRLTALPAYCIGPVTSAVARSLGFTTPVVASTHTAAGLAEAIYTHLKEESR